MKLRHADLIASLAALCLAAIVMLFAADWLVPRLIVSIVLVFFLPGYTLICAVSPMGEWDLTDTMVMSIGFSLAIGVLGSLVLHGLRFGLYQNTWLAMYLLQCCACILVALWQRYTFDIPAIPMTRMPKFRLLPLLPIAIGVMLILGAWVFGSIAQTIQHQDAFTQLWITPCKTDDCDVQLGVYNYEWHPEDYRLVLMANAVVIKEWDDISLDHEKTWSGNVFLPAGSPNNTSLLARLYLKSAPDTPYRYVTLRRIEPEN